MADTTSPRIRPARPADLDGLLRLYEQLSPGTGAPPRALAQAALDALLAAPHLHLLVAELDGELAGTVTLVVTPGLTHLARPWAQLENMVVGESVRGRGLGGLLLQACDAIAREAGCYKIQLQSADHRTAAHAFYEGHGYRATSKGYRLYFDGS